jgi:GT2 family glycosyltransferase
VDQSERFLGNDFNYDNYLFPIRILKGDITKGVNHSRNIALKEYSNEDWLFFLDDDLRVEKAELFKILNYLTTYTFDVIVPGINNTRDRKDQIINHYNILDSLCKPQSYDLVSNRIIVSSGLTLVNKHYFFKAGGKFDERFTFWGDDWDFGLRLYRAGATIKYIPEINFTHLQVNHGGQRSFKGTTNLAKKKTELNYYLIKKHFGKSALKERVLIDLIINLKKAKVFKMISIFSAYQASLE